MTDAVIRTKPTGIRLEGVRKRFKGGVEAVRGIDLDVKPGEFMVLVGPSGCGKSTVLRMIAGLEETTAGRIYLGDTDVTTELPQRRDVAMVFQSYALYPRMSVRRNMGFGLRMRGISAAARQKRVSEVASVLGLEHLLDRRPAALSGGQRQRVAMGRAIVREPKVFLMDEPLSNLDAKLRVSMRAQLSLLHKRLGVTTVYVTHDQIEAMTLGQRVAVLRDGELQQCDTPQNLFRRPVNLFVAAFIGSPSMNFVQADVRGDAVHFAGVSVPLPPNGGPSSTTTTGVGGTWSTANGQREVILGVRPTALTVPRATSGASAGWPRLTVVPDLVEDLGDERYVIFELDAPRVDTEATRAAVDATTADDALLTPLAERAHFTARLPADAPVTVGEPLELAINPERLHLFDPSSGAALTPPAG
jgi:multiple sugar transport system ATP-binding protein